MFRLVAGARVDRFDYLDNFVFSPRVTFMVKPQERPDVPRVLQPRLPLAVGRSTTSSTCTIARADRPVAVRAAQPGAQGLIYPLPVESVGNPDLKETSLDAFEVGYTGVVAQGRAIVSAAFYVNKHERRHLLHRGYQRALQRRRIRRRLAARAAAAGGIHLSAGGAAGEVHLSELRRNDAEGRRARRDVSRQPLTWTRSPTTRSRRRPTSTSICPK